MWLRDLRARLSVWTFDPWTVFWVWLYMYVCVLSLPTSIYVLFIHNFCVSVIRYILGYISSLIYYRPSEWSPSKSEYDIFDQNDIWPSIYNMNRFQCYINSYRLITLNARPNETQSTRMSLSASEYVHDCPLTLYMNETHWDHTHTTTALALWWFVTHLICACENLICCVIKLYLTWHQFRFLRCKHFSGTWAKLEWNEENYRDGSEKRKCGTKKNRSTYICDERISFDHIQP